MRSDYGETSDMKAWKEKKQRRLENERARKDSNPATGVNASDASNVSSGARNDLSEVTSFNCDKKGHYSRNCPELRRDASKYQRQSRQPPCR